MPAARVASSRQPGSSRSRVPQNISVRGSLRQVRVVGERGGDLGAAEVLGLAGPPLGVHVELAEVQPPVDLVEGRGLRGAGGQVDPGGVQHHRGGQRGAAREEAQRQSEGQPAPGGVADERDRPERGTPREVGDQGVVGVAPGVLGRQRVGRHHHAGPERGGQPGGVPHVHGVDRRDEPATVHDVDRAAGGDAARREDVGGEVARGAAEPLGHQCVAALEARHQPGRQPRLEPGVAAGDLPALVLDAGELTRAPESRDRPGQRIVAAARHGPSLSQRPQGRRWVSHALSGVVRG